MKKKSQRTEFFFSRSLFTKDRYLNNEEDVREEKTQPSSENLWNCVAFEYNGFTCVCLAGVKFTVLKARFSSHHTDTQRGRQTRTCLKPRFLLPSSRLHTPLWAQKLLSLSLSSFDRSIFYIFGVCVWVCLCVKVHVNAAFGALLSPSLSQAPTSSQQPTRFTKYTHASK